MSEYDDGPEPHQYEESGPRRKPQIPPRPWRTPEREKKELWLFVEQILNGNLSSRCSIGIAAELLAERWDKSLGRWTGHDE